MSVISQSFEKTNNVYNIPTPAEPGGFSSDLMQVVGTPTSSLINLSATYKGLLLEASLAGSFQMNNGTPKTAADIKNADFQVDSVEFKVGGVLFSKDAYSPQISLKLQDDAVTLTSAAVVVYGGNDTFIGALNPGKEDGGDTVDGFGGNDVFYGNGSGRWDDVFYGGSGTDTSVYRGKSTSYTVTSVSVWNEYTQKADLQGCLVTDKTGLDGRQQLSGVERLKFTDGTLALDFSRGENGYKAAMLIGAAFGKDKVSTFFAPAIGLFDQGMTTDGVAKLVTDLKLIENTIGSSSNKSFVSAVYKNVTGVLPDALTEAMFTSYLDTGAMDKAQLLSLASGVAVLENQIGLTGLQTTGLIYTSFI
jgi:hypothetical protein